MVYCFRNKTTSEGRPLWGGGGGGIRLNVGFQPLKVISPTASWIWSCMQVYAGIGIWTYHLFGPNDLCPIEQKGITQTIIVTPS